MYLVLTNIVLNFLNLTVHHFYLLIVFVVARQILEEQHFLSYNPKDVSRIVQVTETVREMVFIV